MKEVNEAILFPELLSPDERKVLRTALDTDPALKEAFRYWQRVREEVRRNLDEILPEQDLLVSYALFECGAGSALSVEEQQALGAARHGIERALRQHPGLADAIRRIQADVDCFDGVWEEHCGKTTRRFSFSRRDRMAIVPGARSRGNTRMVWRIAAGMTAVLFLAITYLIVQRDRGFEVVRTAPGETRRIELADGSTVRLMGGSELSYVNADQEDVGARRTKLKGRAYFDVTPGRQPFTVETPAALATVLGTTFGVSAEEHVTEVVLTSGRVAVAPRVAPERMVTLEPGEKTRVEEDALPSTPASVNVTEELHWTGLFIFNASSLEDIASALARHHKTPVSIPENLRYEPVTGTFEQEQPLDEVLRAVAATLGASVEGDREKGYRITARS